ncbi:MAG TPA: phytoene desaturase family protein [Acetobacteraceae bacterium]|nr:phytoene desaturase family protein [Acetobacteraceae bacterium]
MLLRTPRIAIIGAGAAGIAAAVDLARQGVAVSLFERQATPGGKIRTLDIAGAQVDAGPTVLTMRWVFESLFADAGSSLDAHLTLHPCDVLARHAWSGSERLDLFADIRRSEDAIGSFAGAAAAQGYRSFVARAARVYGVLEAAFIRGPRPSTLSLISGVGLRGVSDLIAGAPFATLWHALGEHFSDPRLRQLFARYATYSGSSPFHAPATLMLIAHVEQQGVWTVTGGMIQVAEAMAGLAARQGAELHYAAPVSAILLDGGRVSGVRLATGEEIAADAVIANADIAALTEGLFGPRAMAAVRSTGGERSLSALSWAVSAATTGFPLARHNVFFARDYAAEFDAIFRARRLPSEPTVYVCAQDRGAPDQPEPKGTPERLLLLVNAPAIGDQRAFTAEEIKQCEAAVFDLLTRCGLMVDRPSLASMLTTPTEFEALFPATGGALYGQAVHGAMAAFRRPGSRSAIPGLYLAGGSVHPGPGVPMAVLSGRLAARSTLEDLTSR